MANPSVEMAKTFMTEIGNDDEFEDLPRTSQSTQLLHSRTRLKDEQRKLNDTRESFRLKMIALDKKKNDLYIKQDQMKQSVVKFDRFIRESDAKRARALKKAKDEERQRESKESEIVKLEGEIEKLKHEHEKKKRQLRMEQQYKDFLELTMDVQTSYDFNFEEKDDILNRHEGLMVNKKELEKLQEVNQQGLEEAQINLSNLLKNKENTLLNLDSTIASKQSDMEDLRSEVLKQEQALIKGEQDHKSRIRTLAEIRMAVTNLYLRLTTHSLVSRKQLTELETLPDKIEFIGQRFMDFEAIIQLVQEKKEVVLPNIPKEKNPAPHPVKRPTSRGVDNALK